MIHFLVRVYGLLELALLIPVMAIPRYSYFTMLDCEWPSVWVSLCFMLLLFLWSVFILVGQVLFSLTGEDSHGT